MKALLVPACLLALSGEAAAQLGGTIEKIDRSVTRAAGDATVIAGAGIGVATLPYRDLDDPTRVFPLPVISFESGRYRLVGKTASARLADYEALSFDAVADIRFLNFDEDDSPYLRGMDDRDGTLELGGRLSAELGPVELWVTGLADALSRHGGYEISAQAQVELSSWRPLSVRPNAGLRYQSSSLTDYYFGVDRDEALAVNCITGDCGEIFRPAYEVDDAVLPFVGISARQAFSYKIAAFAQASYEFLPDTIADSPIVEDEGRFTVFGGLVYIFGDAGRRMEQGR